jgi:hypothetical protein
MPNEFEGSNIIPKEKKSLIYSIKKKKNFYAHT